MIDLPFRVITADRSSLSPQVFADVPTHSAVFKIFDINQNLIVLDKTHNLSERLARHFPGSTDAGRIAGRTTNLWEIAGRIEYRRTASPLETALVLYRERKKHFPDTYRDMRTFRLFDLVKVNKKQRFPRIYFSNRIKQGVDYFGPFVSRTQAERLKTTLERTFKLRPCLYNIRGNDPHPDCMYFQMHTCSRPCANDITRPDYLRDVESAILFICGKDAQIESEFHGCMSRYAENADFETAAVVQRRLEKIRRARAEYKDIFWRLSEFNFVGILPADTSATFRLVTVRQGWIVAFDEYPKDIDQGEIDRTLAGHFGEGVSPNREDDDAERHYEEFCLVCNYIVSPVKSVELLPVENLQGLGPRVLERVRSKRRKRGEIDADTVA